MKTAKANKTPYTRRQTNYLYDRTAKNLITLLSQLFQRCRCLNLLFAIKAYQNLAY